MNHVYRFIWNDLAAAAALLAAGSALAQQPPAPGALPTGGNVVAGQAAIAQNGANMTITQGSQQAILNWNSFNIGAQAHVNFVQPNASAVALNRVLSSDPSAIYGKLSANGQVFLVNPNGVIFGAGSRVDVGGLVASTMDIRNEDFLAGRMLFSRSGALGAVVNQGEIRAAEGGYVALLAPEVRNEGVIAAAKGTVALAAGDAVTLDFSGNRLVSFAVDPATVKTLIENKQLIEAQDGQVLMTARAADALLGATIKNSGTVEATSLTSRGGVIRLGGADEIALTGTLDASGATGGGEILVGGDWQGAHIDGMGNARTVTADANTVLKADATGHGNGGKVVVWSDGSNTFAGRISVRGGAQGGDGGQAEVSGLAHLAYTGITDARAPHGKTGDLLLDPTSIDIVDGGSGSGGVAGSTVYERDLEEQLANITLQTSGGGAGYIRLNDLTTDGVITLQPGISLTIIAGDYFNGEYHSYSTVDVNDEIRASGSGQIYIRAAMSISSGKLSSDSGKITLWGDNGLTVGNTITTHGGDVELWADSDNLGGGILILNQAVTTNGGDVDLDAGTSGVQVNAPISTGSGRVYFDRLGTVRNAVYRVSSKISSTGDVDINQTLQFGAGAEIETNGKITISGSSSMQNAGASLTLTASSFDFQQAIAGNSGTVILNPYASNTDVDIGTANGGGMLIDHTALSRLTGFSNIVIGRTDGTGTTRVNSDTSVAAAGRIELINDVIDINGGSLTNTAGDVVLRGNLLDIGRAVTANGGNGMVALRQLTPGSTIDVGSSITNSLLNQINAATLEIGSADGGDLTFSSDIATTASTVHLLSGGNVTATAGGVSAANLAVTAGGDIEITDSTFDFTTLALHAGGNVDIEQSRGDFSIGSAGGLTGVTLAHTAPATVNIAATADDADLTVASAIVKTGVNATDLNLRAAHSVIFSAAGSATATGGMLNVNLDADQTPSGGFVNTLAGSSIITNGGSVSMTGDYITHGGNLHSAGGTVTLTGNTVSVVIDATGSIDAGTGTINLIGHGYADAAAIGNDGTIITTGTVNMTGIGGAISAGSGTVNADTLNAKTLADGGARVDVAGHSTHVSLASRNAADTADAAGRIVYTDGVGGYNILGVNTTDRATLRSAGTVSQMGAIVAGQLRLESPNNDSAAWNLTHTGNRVGQIAALQIGNLDFINDGSLAVNGAGVSSTGTVSLYAVGAEADLTLNGAVAGTAAAGQTAVVLAADRHFVNLAGSSAVDAGTGRWLVYSAGLEGNTFGGLASGEHALWNHTYADNIPATITATGNRYLFAQRPVLTITALDQSKKVGETVSFDAPVAGTHYQVSGLVDAAQYGNVFEQDTISGLPLLASAGAAADASAAGTPYAITVDAGTLSVGDYALVLAAGQLKVTNPAPPSTAVPVPPVVDVAPPNNATPIGVNPVTTVLLPTASAHNPPTQLVVQDGGLALPPVVSLSQDVISPPVPGNTPTGSFAPSSQIPSQITPLALDLSAGQRLTLSLGQGFLSTGQDSAVMLSARMADGRPLPNWLSFNPGTGELTGTPPPGFRGQLQIQVIARDNKGNQGQQNVELNMR